MAFDAYDRSIQLLSSLACLIKKLATCNPDLTKQLRRAAQSVSLNISEANQRCGKDRRHLFRVALGSAAEVASCLDIAVALDYLGEHRGRARPRAHRSRPRDDLPARDQVAPWRPSRGAPRSRGTPHRAGRSWVRPHKSASSRSRTARADIGVDRPAPGIRDIERGADLGSAAVGHGVEPPAVLAGAARTLGDIVGDAGGGALDLVGQIRAVLPELREDRAEGADEVEGVGVGDQHGSEDLSVVEECACASRGTPGRRGHARKRPSAHDQ